MEVAVTSSRARVIRILAMAASAGLVCMPALATEYHWAVPNGTWNNGPNWDPSGAPGTGDSAIIDYFSNATCHVLGPVGNPALLEIYLGDTLDLEHNGMADGFVNVSGDVYVGNPDLVLIPTSGTLNVFGKPPLQVAGQGRLQVGGNLTTLVASVVNQSGGTVSLTGTSSYLLVEGSSTFNMSAGALSAPLAEVDSTFNLSGTGVANLGGFNLNGTFNQTGGQLFVGPAHGPYQVHGKHILSGGLLDCYGMTLTGSASTLFSYQGGTFIPGSIYIDNGAQLHVGSGGGKVLRCTGLSIISGGIDLTDNAMIVDYSGSSPLNGIATLIKNGSYNGATGNASGIISSTAINPSSHKTALGYGEASTLGVTLFKGQSVGTASVLVAYTYAGDANLDGKVNALDFNALAKNFGGSTGKFWTQGDFNYDGSVNGLDFTALGTNFNQPALGSPVVGTIVPEPDMVACAIVLARCASRSPLRSARGRKNRENAEFILRF